ncbi:Immunoglobulin superfamily member 5 [Oryzias melastigma]|nr:Immunoglobulin superfamily member 5 [Oryzias melastigma]
MVLWKIPPVLLCMSVLLRSVEMEVQLEPMNATVLLGSDIQFYARVQGSWDVMTWQARGFQVLTIRKNGEVTSENGFSAMFCQDTETSCVQFTIYNISRADAGPVSCIVQGSYAPQTAYLSVQESGTLRILGGNQTVNQVQQVRFQCVAAGWYPTPSISWSENGQAVDSSLFNTSSSISGGVYNSTSILSFSASSSTTIKCLASISALQEPLLDAVFLTVVPPDWTVLVAVVVSFGSCALLVLLIVGIVFYNKRRKSKQLNYTDEMRKVRTQSHISSITSPENRRGRDNPSFQVHTAESGDVSTNQHSSSNDAQVKDLVKQAQSMKHRHVTIV